VKWVYLAVCNCPLLGSCGHGNEPSSYIKFGELRE
jgi:hypothetical protein